MSFLFRTPLIVRPKKAFVDWVNGLEGPRPTEQEVTRPTIYLSADSFRQPTLDEVVTASWEAIFEEELDAWSRNETEWPGSRTREMFTEWFDVELADGVNDLVPEDPLTNDDMDAAELDAAIRTCGWCGRDLDEAEGRVIGFPLKDREGFAHYEGRAMPIALTEECVAFAIVTAPDSKAAQSGDDIVFTTCSRDCERALKSRAPRALQRVDRVRQ